MHEEDLQSDGSGCAGPYDPILSEVRHVVGRRPTNRRPKGRIHPRAAAAAVKLPPAAGYPGRPGFCLEPAPAAYAGLGLGLFELGWVRSAITTLGMLPLTLAGLGVREGAMISLLAPYGVTPVVAVTFSLLLFLTGVVVALAGGALVAYDLLAGGGWQPGSKATAEQGRHA